MIGALALALLLQQAPAPAAPREDPRLPVQRGVTTVPDTVTVGEPFRVVVRIHAPAGAGITFPAGPDSGATVEAVDPRIVRDSRDASATDRSAIYRLTAWDVGWQPLRLGDAVVRLGDRQRHVTLGDLRVFVRSVLPADSTKRVPKPARGLMEIGRPWWLWLLAALAALAIIGLLLWWWWRRRRRASDEAEARDPYEVAEERFERIERLGLIEAGERGRHVALSVEVLREYLARAIPEARVSLTTTELLAAARGEPLLPSTRLAVVLSEADLVKFAARPIAAERARELGREARAIARTVHEATTAAAAAAGPPGRAEEAA